jgi:hypothetical protein
LDPRGPASVEPGGALVVAPTPILLSVGEAWLLCALYVGVIGGLALLAFRARDVQ